MQNKQIQTIEVATNAITIATIAGLEHLPEGVRLSQQLTAEIERIHPRIRGKRTLIHGISVAHILGLEADLNSIGISAKAIYGGMEDGRQEVVQKVKSGEIQVLLGDQLTGRGLDIPELEVGIHTAPTVSSRELAQQVGRLFRHSPQTGKERGIAIQLVHKFTGSSSRRPVLIPEILEPGFVLRGSSKGNKETRSKREKIASSSDLPTISISGNIDLEGYIEEMRLQDVLQTRFRNASLGEMNVIVLDIVNNIMAEQAGKEISLFEVYSKLAENLPSRVSEQAYEKALDAIKDPNTENSALGKQVFIALNLKTIMGVLDRYANKDLTFNNDLLHHVLSEIIGGIDRFHNRYGISNQVHAFSQQAARRFISQKKLLPIGWIEKGIDSEIEQEFENA